MFARFAGWDLAPLDTIDTIIGVGPRVGRRAIISEQDVGQKLVFSLKVSS